MPTDFLCSREEVHQHTRILLKYGIGTKSINEPGPTIWMLQWLESWVAAKADLLKLIIFLDILSPIVSLNVKKRKPNKPFGEQHKDLKCVQLLNSNDIYKLICWILLNYVDRVTEDKIVELEHITKKKERQKKANIMERVHQEFYHLKQVPCYQCNTTN